ncbi:DUF4231 domain-containing protein [Actinoplanes sp. NPDC051475]|uniref:DUF4231 domain-containing protein n=1 Tax=Actinoplanes sp. NPDC051475 TaxID=3157225 RepID=UPI00344EEAA9
MGIRLPILFRASRWLRIDVSKDDVGYRRCARYEELIVTLEEMYPAAEQVAYIRTRWGDRTAKAEAIARRNKAWYYWLRGSFVCFAALAPPASAGSAFIGDYPAIGGLAVFISVMVVIIAAAIELRKPGERWRLYQRLRFDLEAVGWALAESRPPAPRAASRRKFQRFVDQTEHLMSRFGKDYIAQISVISASDYESRHQDRSTPAMRRRSDLPSGASARLVALIRRI